MLNVPEFRNKAKLLRNHRREKKLWHDSRSHMPSLGCSACPDQKICGGLFVENAFYHCLDYCCGNPEKCDAVCRNKPRDFAQRVREVGGFRLDNIPRAPRAPEPLLPPVIPVLFHGNAREVPFAPTAVSIPLYRVIARHRGEERYTEAKGLAAAFNFQEGTPLVLTGTANDRPLERWWSLGPGRLDAIRRLRDFGVKLVTTPNFSLFTDQPRWDDMHSMKRIAITHEEFLREGVQAALHVNARTERDWERWTEYIRLRSEVTHVAFEFATGAGWAERSDWHAARLAELAEGVGRPLHLVVRAANSHILPKLISSFAKTTVLDTTSFIKSIHRQRAVETDAGKIEWETSPTAPNAPVDELLTHNWSVINRSYDRVFDESASWRAAE